MTDNSDARTFDVTLRRVKMDDLPTLFQHQLDPDAVRMAVVYPRDADSFQAHWTRILEDSSTTALAILTQGTLVGSISCFRMEGKFLVGYWIAKDQWGRGIGTRALALLLQDVTSRPLYAHVASHNVGSIRVLTRNGFVIQSYEFKPADDRYPECEEVLLELA